MLTLSNRQKSDKLHQLLSGNGGIDGMFGLLLAGVSAMTPNFSGGALCKIW